MARSSNIDVRLRMRGARQFNREVQASAAQLEAMGVRGAGAMGKFALQADKLKNFGRKMTMGVTLPVAAASALSVKAASDWESAFAGVEKTVDAPRKQLDALAGSLRAMALEIPVSTTELAGIAEAAGQLGIQTKNIAGFTRVMADLGVATDLTSTDAASELAKFANITQMPQSQFERLGSTIVDLGNKMATTESEIVTMGMRIAGAGNQVGMSQAEIMSFAAGLSSVGIKAEAGGTAISQSFIEMNNAVAAGGDGLASWAKVAGMSAGSFKQTFKTDAAGAMTTFMEGLQRIKAGGGNVSETLDGLGLSGIRVQDMMMRSAGAGDLLRKSLQTGDKAWKENNALSEEARKRYKTFSSRLIILKNTVKDLGITIGNKLLPPLTRFVEWIGPKIQGAVKTFSKLPKPVKTAAAGFVVLLAVIGPLAWILGGIAGGVGQFLIVMTKLAPIIKAVVFITRVWTVALLTNPIVLIVVGIIALIAVLVLAYHKIDWFRAAVDAAFAWIKTAVSNAVKAVVGFVKKHWKLLIILLGGPIGIAVVLVIKHWNTLKSAATNTVKWVINAFHNVVSFFSGLPGKISGVFRGLFDGLKEAFRSAVNFIINGWNSLKFEIPPVEVLGKEIFPGVTLGVPQITPLATGGTVTGAGLTMVGENGPELRYMPKAASVIPLNREVVREAVGGSDRPIHTHVYLKGKEIALAVSDQVADAGARA